MDEGPDVDLPGSVPCDICGRPVRVTPTRIPGSSGLDTGSRVDNRSVCESCRSGRYSPGKRRRRGS